MSSYQLIWNSWKVLTSRKAFPSGVWTEKWKVLREFDSLSSRAANVFSRKWNLHQTRIKFSHLHISHAGVMSPMSFVSRHFTFPKYSKWKFICQTRVKSFFCYIYTIKHELIKMHNDKQPNSHALQSLKTSQSLPLMIAKP